MIWFNCKQCGKTHGRPENSAGTMIFCECGGGNTVPWESTAPPPASPPVATPAPKVPDLAPIQFDPVTIPTPPSALPPTTTGDTYPTSPTPTAAPAYDDEDDQPRRGRHEKRDPDYCFNHQRRPKVGLCPECQESFCQDCLVKFQDQLMCGPCKNFLARHTELPPSASSLANVSLIISLVAGPLLMCLLLVSPGSSAMRILSWLSLLPQVLALGLGVWALYEAEKERKGGGQWVAMTGVAASTLTCVLMILLNYFADRLV
ncbi:MAG: hypothetical protein FJ303_16615 [Planctomycetes bacterium]|nr:hypothetical protein [Planctomycetota bacterium]